MRLIEQAVLNPRALECGQHPDRHKGWRCFRIEYGFECGCPEGLIYLPPFVDPDEAEAALVRLVQQLE